MNLHVSITKPDFAKQSHTLINLLCDLIPVDTLITKLPLFVLIKYSLGNLHV